MKPLAFGGLWVNVSVGISFLSGSLNSRFIKLQKTLGGKFYVSDVFCYLHRCAEQEEGQVEG